eukprot:4518763-Pyramimonas_sp.AAC.1
MNAEGVEETYAYQFGSVGFVRFTSPKLMYEFLRKFNSRPKPTIGNRTTWVSVSRSPEERKKGKALGKYKRFLIEIGGAPAEK